MHLKRVIIFSATQSKRWNKFIKVKFKNNSTIYQEGNIAEMPIIGGK